MTTATMTTPELIALACDLDELLEVMPGVGEAGHDEPATLAVVERQLEVDAELRKRNDLALKDQIVTSAGRDAWGF